MAVFNFPYHKVSTEYPESSFRAQLGNSYQFTAPPTAPDQRIFILKFNMLKWFTVAGGGLNRTAWPEINLALLDDFYNAHKLHATFTYKHPIYGDLNCRFNKPLKIPEGVEGGDGAVKDIQLEFIEVPGIAASEVSQMVEIQYTPF